MLSAQAHRGLLEALEADGEVTLPGSRVTVRACDYESDGRPVEAVLLRPPAGLPVAGVLRVPGFRRTARDAIPVGLMYALAGFACMAVSQPGFGRSQGPPDFVGPRTIRALTDGLRHLAQQPGVDGARIGVDGYSRGALAAAILAVRAPGVRAAVLGGGVYDFRLAHDHAPEGVRANMRTETGLTENAILERSPIFEMERLRCPVLILHGEADENAPVEQALRLRDRLLELGKAHEAVFFPGQGHGLDATETVRRSVEFFRRTMT